MRAIIICNDYNYQFQQNKQNFLLKSANYSVFLSDIRFLFHNQQSKQQL